MTVRAPDMSRLFVLGLAVGLTTVAAGCRGSDSSTDVEDVAFASRSRPFEECCQRQFPPGRHRNQCVDEARHGRCRLDCRPRHDAGTPDAPVGSPDASVQDSGAFDAHAGGQDAGVRDAGGADGPAGGPDAAHDAGGTICPTLTPLTPNVLGTIAVGETVEIFVSATDSSGGAATLTFNWSTTAGSLQAFPARGDQFEADGFADFLCTGASTATVTVTVADGACPLTESVDLTCSFCGDGVLESGEDCDPPNTTPDGRILCGKHLPLH